MTATLQWLDLTATDRDKVRRVLDLFKEQGTVDELGLGSLRDALSDALFPGTSVLHTRLRYVLFVPWLYQRFEHQGVRGDLSAEMRQQEVALIDHLAEQGEEGVIGVQARAALARLPSNVYWAALSRWGIFVPGKSQSWYHAHFSELRRSNRTRGNITDDPGVLSLVQHTWHPRLPSVPVDFPEGVSFALTGEEARFVQEQLRTACDGSLLGWLAEQSAGPTADHLWEHPEAMSAPKAVQETVGLARQFSLVVEGAPLVYNLMLAEKRASSKASDAAESDHELADRYREQITEWLERAQEDLQTFRPEVLWAFVEQRGVRSPKPQRRFLEDWLRLVRSAEPQVMMEDPALRSLITTREQQLKGNHRARLQNAGRLADWRGDVGVGRMAFRWPQVRRLLNDLADGLTR